MSFIKIPNKNFSMADAPVTQRQWTKIMGNNPSSFMDKPENPVEHISWYEVQEFIKKLNERSVKWVFRLPTEEEWEYCCRAGTTTEYYWGSDKEKADKYTWYYKNSNASTQPVKQKKPNAWKLYDMSGNVFEWTSSVEKFKGQYRVIRGGSWGGTMQGLRSSYRDCTYAYDRYSYLGFRLVRSAK